MLTTEFNIEDAKRVLYSDGELKESLYVAKNMLQDGIDFITVAKLYRP
ncbi:hypothetical protein FACS1894133_5630 [Clostridia bacterium]|nr:hypothetical protein FACS1894133_5630 [Clostridia bacterium]